MQKIVTTLDLIRHGEPIGGRKYRGHVDDPLSEKGWRQMREAVGEHRPWHAVASSSLLRCAEFAREMAERHTLPMTIDERFKEIGFGIWEGKSAAEIEALWPGSVARFSEDPVTHRPEGAETLEDFRSRVIGAWNELIDRHRGQHVLVVGHAGMIRMIIREVLDMPLPRMYRIQVANAAISRIEVEDRGNRRVARLLFHDGRL